MKIALDLSPLSRTAGLRLSYIYIFTRMTAAGFSLWPLVRPAGNREKLRNSEIPVQLSLKQWDLIKIVRSHCFSGHWLVELYFILVNIWAVIPQVHTYTWVIENPTENRLFPTENGIFSHWVIEWSEFCNCSMSWWEIIHFQWEIIPFSGKWSILSGKWSIFSGK